MTTPNAQSLDGLIERVRIATGPDRELDIAIGDALPPAKIFSSGHWFNRDDFIRYPAVTNSIDAALALVERCLPGKWDAVLHMALASLWAENAPNTPHNLLPKYVILALLTALQDQNNER